MIGPLYTGLTFGVTPGTPSLPAFDVSPLTDSWAITESVETSSIVTSVIGINPAAETWSLVWNDTRLGEPLDIPFWFTDIGLDGTIPRNPDALTNKSQTGYNSALSADTWFVVWGETPVDLVQWDLFDSWILRYSNELPALNISQAFPATEFWSLSFSEASTLSTTNAQFNLALNDPWGIRWNDVSGMFEDNPITDTWAISYSPEVSALLNIPAVTDTWSITYSAETSAVVTDAPVVINTTDTWSVSAADVSALVMNLFKTATDTWSAAFVDSSSFTLSDTRATLDIWALGWQEVTPADVQPTPVFSDLADTFSISHQFEVASISNIPQIDIIGSDQWSLVFASENTALFSTLIQTPPGRLIKVGGTRRRVIKVE